MKASVVSAVGGCLAAIASMLFGQNEPAQWLRGLVVRDGRFTRIDLFIRDRYFVLEPVLFVVNLVVFGAALFFVARLLSRSSPTQGAAGA